MCEKNEELKSTEFLVMVRVREEVKPDVICDQARVQSTNRALHTG